MQIEEIKLDDGSSIFIEVGDTDIVKIEQQASNLPAGATPVSAKSQIANTLSQLKNTIGNVVNIVNESVKENKPSEYGFEVNIAFKGKTNIVPVIVSSELSSAIKLHAKWVNKEN